jgi:erythromycin esterase-like protein
VLPTTDGTPAPIVGLGENSTLVEKRIDGRHVEHTWKVGFGTQTGKSVLSKNGKNMTYTLTGTGPDGKPVHNVEIFEKQ